MDLPTLRTLVDYHYWARDRLLDGVSVLTPEQFTRDMGGSFRSVRDTCAHIYAAEWAWYSRWQGTSPTALLPPDQFPDVTSLRQQWSEHETLMRTFLESLGEAGIHRVFQYTLINGQPGATVFWPMLQHVVNHASYHRGQVTTLLRQLGAAPPKSMDLIAFYRLRAMPEA
jgi:uncharacterized damage-inducible protein DinB